MKMLIVSHTPHYATTEGISGWGPTVREIDRLSSLFTTITHLAILHRTENVPESSLSYTSPNVRLRLLPPAGGHRFRDKLTILAQAPIYLKAILEEIGKSEFVHVRCPANLSLLCLLVLIFSKRPPFRWVKYAGNWDPKGRRPWSYAIQRFILQNNIHRGTVSVNGHWANQSQHILSFHNPSFSNQELKMAAKANMEKRLLEPLQLLYVGRLESDKGLDLLIELALRLHRKPIQFVLDIVGDGSGKGGWQSLTASNGLGQIVNFRGWLRPEDLDNYYAGAHFLILPSLSEGWPKVLSEGMAFGVVPLASGISAIPQNLSEFGCGKALPPGDVQAYVSAIESYLDDPGSWKRESRAGKDAAHRFTYESYLSAVRQMAKTFWGIDLEGTKEVDEF